MSNPLVSVIIIFFNAEKFLVEAIDSVLAQTYPHWELLLVDDGSRDGSRAIAARYASLHSERVRVLSHPENQNRGKGATRNLGIKEAKGEYIGFLDADDLWLPHKLEEQIAILERFPDAGILYGDTLYWYSWTEDPQDLESDFVPALRVPLDRLIEPPQLLPLYLRGKAAVPCTCSILVKQSVARAVGGFDETFTGPANIYEDQAFYAKIVLIAKAIVVGRCWDYYRQHSQASMSVAIQTGQQITARTFYLDWLEKYLKGQNVRDGAVWQALRREQWRLEQPAWLPASGGFPQRLRWLKKWVLRVEEQLLPSQFSRLLWKNGIE